MSRKQLIALFIASILIAVISLIVALARPLVVEGLLFY